VLIDNQTFSALALAAAALLFAVDPRSGADHRNRLKRLTTVRHSAFGLAAEG